MVNERTALREITGKSPSYYIQKKSIASYKSRCPELTYIHSQVLQDVAKRVDLAFQSFFRRVKQGETPGYPRLKGKGVYDSITYGNSGYSFVKGNLKLSKIDTPISIRLHREMIGDIKTCTIRRLKNKWYACFSVEFTPDYSNCSNEEVGIDVGIKKFAFLSNNTWIDNPKFFRQEEANLAKAQRKFDKVKNKHKSKARRKAKQIVSRIHERVRNRRHNFIHQETRKIINQFGLINLEGLNVKNMSKSPATKQDEITGEYLPNGASRKAGLNKSILDAAWSMFRNTLSYKAENAGGKVIEKNPAYTSQRCSVCGCIDSSNRVSQSIFCCVRCGHTENADFNASKNMNWAKEINTVGQYSMIA